jgi:TRAP-type mannitol/chloroaromatic compound transport system permease large subunit
VREQRKVMKTEGKSWKWAWWLLVAGGGLQFYFVQELVAAFVFFAIGFAALALVIVTLYLLQKGWEAAVARFPTSEEFLRQGL